MERGRGSTDRHPFFPPPSRPLPLGNPGCPFGLVSIVQTSRDGSHGWKGGKQPQASVLGCDLLPLPSQAGGLEGKAEERQVNSQEAKERDLPLPSSHILSPSSKSGTPELELRIVPPNYIQASPGSPGHPSSPGPASGTGRVGGC